MHKSTPLLSTHSNHNKEKRVVGEQGAAGSKDQRPKEEMDGLTQNHYHHQRLRLCYHQ